MCFSAHFIFFFFLYANKPTLAALDLLIAGTRPQAQ